MPQPDFSNVQSGSSSSADKKETSWWELFKETWEKERAEFVEFGHDQLMNLSGPFLPRPSKVKGVYDNLMERITGAEDKEDIVDKVFAGADYLMDTPTRIADKQRGEYASTRDEFLSRSDMSPEALASADTLSRGISILTGPEDVLLGGGALKKVSSLSRAVPSNLTTPRINLLKETPSAVPKVPKAPKINLLKEGPNTPKEAPKVTTQEAMEHAGDAASPEAISRTENNHFFKIRKSGELIPVPGVDAIDVKVNPNEILIQVGRDGSVTHIRGSASGPEVSRTLRHVEQNLPGFKSRVTENLDEPLVYYIDEADKTRNFTVIDTTPPGYGKVKTFDAVDPDTGVVIAEMETFSPLDEGFVVNKLTGTTGKRFKKSSDLEPEVLEGLYREASSATGGKRLKRVKGSGATKKMESKIDQDLLNKETEPPVYKEDPERGMVRIPIKLWRWAQRNFNQQGMTSDIAAKFAKDTPQKKFFRREVPNYFEIQKSEQRDLEFDLLISQNDLHSAILDASKNAGVNPKYLQKKLWEARTLPKDPDAQKFLAQVQVKYPELYRAYENTTGKIDEFSQKFIDEGVVNTSEEVTTLKANMGRYLHRFYEAANDPKWFKKMEDSDEFQKLYDWIATSHPKFTHNDILARMQKYIDNVTGDAPELFHGRKTIERLSLKELEKRRVIPQEVQDFLKVYEDIGINSEQTSLIMVRDLTLQRMYNKIAERGQELGVFRFDASGRFSKKVIGNVGPLDGMYTHPDIAALLKQIDEGSTMSWLTWASGLEKFAKIGYSHGTQLRNFESGFLMTLANGRLPYNIRSLNKARSVSSGVIRKFSDGFFEDSSVMKFFDVKDKNNFLTEVRELFREGVIGRGAYSGDFEVYLRDVGKKKITEKVANNAFSQFIARLYRSGDDFWKVYNYTQEKKRLQWIYGKNADEAAVRKEAAEIISQQMQTYDRAPAAARKLSRFPGVGPYATFHVEMPRNILNILKRSGYEYKMAVKTNNPKWAMSATSRLGGIFSALAVFGMYEEYKNAKLGISDAEEDALRYFYPSYMENSRAPVTDLDGTKYTVLNTSYVNPYSLMDSMYIALMRPGDFGDKIANMTQVVSEQFLAPELLARAAVEGAVGKRIGPMGIGTGADIRNEATTTAEQLKDTAYHEYRGLAPGSATSLENLARGAGILDPKDPRYPWREYKFWEEFGAQFGPRWMTIDVDTAFSSFSAAFGAKQMDLNKEYRTLQQKEDPEMYQRMERNWQEHYNSLQKAVLNARILGVPDASIREHLSERANMRTELIDRIMTGQYASFAEWKKIDILSDNPLLKSLPSEEQAKMLDAINSSARKKGTP